jgi:hypothetical protein
MAVGSEQGHVAALVEAALGQRAAQQALTALTIAPSLLAEGSSIVSRAAFATAMNIVLFHGLLERVPSGAAYVADTVARGGKVTFDHGALRTVRMPLGPTGALPPGEDAFTRIFLPLGYQLAGVYPLDRLKMTGRAYMHADAPEEIPQFFLSELHIDRFDPAFGEVAARAFGTSRDPLNAQTVGLLDSYACGEPVGFDRAAAALPILISAFDRQHDPVTLNDYEQLLARSHEAAWIATEGNAFNHATDRVPNVAALADRLRQEDWPIKDKIEISRNGRVRQTALRADPVERLFAGNELRQVPGSFYEFISRDVDPATGRLDLSFDASNATGIFAMTSVKS